MYKLAIEDTIEVPVKFTLKAGVVNKTFSFTLTCDRRSQDEISDRLGKAGTVLKDIMLEVTKGWSGQRLILQESGEPADFNAESLDAMLSVAGVANVVFNAYFKDCAAKEKN